MKEVEKQDVSDVKDEPVSAEMKPADEPDREDVTKMDTIPASVAVVSTEPSAEH